MDEDVDGRLERARGREADRAALAARRLTLRHQVRERVAELAKLDEKLAAEESDVRSLEGLSLAALFSAVLGNRSERLAAERGDVLRARLSRDACDASLRALKSDDELIRNALAELAGAPAELAQALADKERVLVSGDAEAARRLAEIDARCADVRGVEKELGEAIAAADYALAALARVESSLDSARNWGTYDLLGGGMIATMVKHGRIDDARERAHIAQSALDRLARETADVRGLAARPLVVEISGFSKFADCFFDGLVADWLVQRRILDSRASVEGVRRVVVRVRDDLGEELRRLRGEQAALAGERRRVVEEG